MTTEEYEVKFSVPENPRRLKSWERIAKAQIQRFYNDDAFHKYISTQVMRNVENPPGPFTRFLYCMSCVTNWKKLLNEIKGRVFINGN